MRSERASYLIIAEVSAYHIVSFRRDILI